MNHIQDKRILIVDDDPELCDLLAHILAGQGAQVCCANDGVAGLDRFQDFHPHLVILDIMMPEIDGLDLCARILSMASVPIVFLSARGRELDVITGLECGAVDYVIKPFSFKVLLARVSAALRQAAPVAAPQPTVPYSDDYLTVDVEARQVLAGGERVELTPTEWRLLVFLVQNRNRPLTYQEILVQVWGSEYQDSLHYVHVHISRLRSKLGLKPDTPPYIHTERGVGYRFVSQSLAAAD